MADNHLEDELNEDEQQDELSNPDVVTKYKTAADIANKALSEVIKQVAPGKLIVELCSLGDKIINDALAQVYKGKATEKGVAFPTSISVNNCCGHFSPLGDDTSKIEEGDVVKMFVALRLPSNEYFLVILVFILMDLSLLLHTLWLQVLQLHLSPEEKLM
jgi:hypothetical protein